MQLFNLLEIVSLNLNGSISSTELIQSHQLDNAYTFDFGFILPLFVIQMYTFDTTIGHIIAPKQITVL